MASVKKYKDLICTIGEEEEVENLSEDSDVEEEFQPTKQSSDKNKVFATDFAFVNSIEEYNKDSWNDLKKYMKRKATSKTDDKINKARSHLKDSDEVNGTQEETDNNVEDDSGDLSLSEDELKHDRITTKAKKKSKKKKKHAEEVVEDNTEEDITDISQYENASFQEMNLSRKLLKAISDMNFVHPTPIQAATVPVALLGRDICGCAATGTGKTAAYMLPTLERLLYRSTDNGALTRVLVLVPTRELGVQVYQVSKQLAQYTDIQIGLAVGGLDLKAQENVLRKKPDIVIATPGRLIDHLKSTPSFGLESIEILILDEADRMLDEYFAEQMKEIVKQCSRTRQTVLFSATMTSEVESLAAVSLTNPVKLFVNSNRDVAFNLRQEFIRIRQDEDREAILGALVCRTFRERCMVFVQTKKQAHHVHILLGLLGLKVAELHGNLTQPQRLEALEKFKNKEVNILVATDVAARGLDIPEVKTVINFVMPSMVEHYIHRVGRTARAGRAGVSVSLAGEQERKMVKDIIKRAKYPVKHRVIPPDIIDKYKKKVNSLEPKVAQILQEEEEERQLNKAENQANKMEKILSGKKEEARPWFQTKQERKKESEKLKGLKNTQSAKAKGKKPEKGKKKKKPEEPDEITRIAQAQARAMKKRTKQKKIATVFDTASGQSKKGVKRKSHFDDLTNTKSAKKFRYQPKNVTKGKNKH